MSVSGLARAQDCAAKAVGGYLLDDPRISCYDPAFRTFQNWGFFVAWLYILVIICTVLLLRGWFDSAPLFKAWSPPLSHVMRTTHLKFLTEAFKEGFTERTWEAMAMIRKALLLGLSTGLVGFTDGRTQITAVLLLLSTAVSLAITYQPYEIDLANQLDLLGLFANLAVAFGVSIRVSAAMSKGYTVNWVELLFFDLAAILLCIPFVIFWFSLILDAIFFGGHLNLCCKRRCASCTDGVHKRCTELEFCKAPKKKTPLSDREGTRGGQAASALGTRNPLFDSALGLSGTAIGEGKGASPSSAMQDGGGAGEGAAAHSSAPLPQGEAKVAFPASSPSLSHRGEGM
jgi:hypothetical protein